MNASHNYQALPTDRTFQDTEANESLFRQFVDKTTDAILVIDQKGIVRFLNPTAERLFDKEMIGQDFGFPLNSDEPLELDIIRPGKDSEIAEMHVVKTEWQGEMLYVANLRLMTEKARLRYEFYALSLTDELTGLANWHRFKTLAEHQFKVAKRLERGLLLLLIVPSDLAQRNQTPDAYDKDQILIEVADQLQSNFRESDIIARIGDSEFAVLAMESRIYNTEVVLTTRLQKSLKHREMEGTESRALSIEIGMAHYDPQAPYSIDALLANARQTMGDLKQRT